MPGGIGPVSLATLLACSRQDREILSVNNANEIFYHLDSHRVIYDSGERYLYFVNSLQGLIARTIRAALLSFHGKPQIEQLHLDRHKLFNGARRVHLDEEQADTVLVALRLVGVRAKIR